MFDHGILENERIYGDVVPPPYELNAIKYFKRIAIVGGTDDLLSAEGQILELENALEYSHSIYYINTVKGLDHIGFLMGDRENNMGWNGLEQKL